MKKAIMPILTVWILVNVGLLSLIIISPEIEVQVLATTIIVDDNGTPGLDCNYTTIQEGIDAASPGDTVFVKNGTYYENVVVNKTINFAGENRDNTVIDGGGSGNVVYVSVDWVNITGFTVTGSGSNSGDAGIKLTDVWNCWLFNNYILSNLKHGIALSASSNNNITNNNISNNNENGILLDSSSSNNIEKNTILSNLENGITLGISSNNKIINNNISNNGRGIWLIDDSSNNNIEENTILSNVNSGIFLMFFCINNNIMNNYVSNNGWGIFIRESSGNNISANNIASSSNYGIIIVDMSDNNHIYHNNIIDNTNQALDDGGNIWDNGYPSGGNYWSDFDDSSEGAYDDYQGVNQDMVGSDGIVDKGLVAGGGKKPYAIPGMGSNQDNYPLMGPFPYFPTENYSILKQGWNLISIPLIQPNTGLEPILSSINGSYDAVQWYNNSDTSDPWKHYQISKPSHLNDFTDIDHTIGFWIHITEPGGVLFEYTGTQPTSNQSITLYPGWNHVGFPSLTPRNRTAALNNLTFGLEVDAIWTFDATTQKWEEIGGGDYFEVGRGYWIHATQECVWEVGV